MDPILKLDLHIALHVTIKNDEYRAGGVSLVELLPTMCEPLADKGVGVNGDDFLPE